MRLLSLRPWPDGPEIELHPRISLIVGLLPFERVEIVSTAHSIATGEVPVWDGRIEVQGVEMNFVEAAEVVGPTAECAPVVTADEIAELASAPIPATEPTKPTSADANVADMREHLAEIADELKGAEKLRAEMQGRVASSKANIRPGVFDDLANADGSLKRAADLADRPDQWTGTSDPAARLERISGMLSETESHLVGLPSGDRVQLATAVAALRVALGAGDVPLPDAVALSERLVVLKERWADILAQFRSLGFDQDGATARLEAARAALRVAEQAATPRKVSAEELSEIEQLHDVCLEYRDKVDGGLRRGAARKKLEGAESELDQVLESIGYTTWSQFRMGNGMVRVTDEVLRSFEVARAELDATELEWAELRTMLETDPYLVEIEGEMSSVDRDAVTLLGLDPGGTNTSDRTERLLKALAGVMIDASSASINEGDAEEQLRAALKACGTTAHNEISSNRALLALGDSWLAVLRESEPARLLLTRLRDRLGIETEALENLGDTSRLDRLDTQRHEVEEVEDRVVGSTAAMREMVQAKIELHVLAATELRMAEDHDAGVDYLERSAMSESTTLGPDSDSGLPIIVMFGNARTTLLEPLLELSRRVQIIVVGDGESLVEWADRLGPDSAGVIDRGVLV